MAVDRNPAPSVENILTRLDSVVDRLEGVYATLIPVIKHRTGSSPAPLMPEDDDDDK